MGGTGSGRKKDPIKNLTPIGNTSLGSDVIFPDYSGVPAHKPTQDAFDKRYAASVHTHAASTNFWVSGSNLLRPQSSTQGISGSYFYTDGNYSGSTFNNETFTGISGSIANNDTLNTSLSGSYFTHSADSSDPHGTTLTQSNIVVTDLSGSRIAQTTDHTTSGSAYCVGVIMATTATPPTASNFSQGTIFIQYTD